MHAQPASTGKRLAGDPCNAAPRHESDRGVRVPGDRHRAAPPHQRIELANALLVHLRVHRSVRRRRAVLVVFDPCGQVVAAGHAGFADRTDARFRERIPHVALQLARRRTPAIDNREAVGFDRMDDFLALSDLAIRHHDHGRLILLRDIEGVDRSGIHWIRWD
jgi:hypothetical protein